MSRLVLRKTLFVTTLVGYVPRVGRKVSNNDGLFSRVSNHQIFNNVTERSKIRVDLPRVRPNEYVKLPTISTSVEFW